MTKLWYFHTAASPPSGGALTRPYDFCKQLNKKGFYTKVFTSAYNHYTWVNIKTPKSKYVEKNEDGVDFIYVRIINYASNGIKRVLSMFSYMFNVISVAKKYTKIHGGPDIILASSPHPLSMVAGIMVAKKLKIPCIVEVRDLWPESIVAYSKRFSKNNLLIKLLYQGEKWIYKKADAVIFTIPGGIDYIKDKHWEKHIDVAKIFNVNNGVDLDKFDYNKEKFIIEDKDLDDDNYYKLVYTGAIRKVNNLGILVDSIKQIKDPKIKLLVWGDGNELLSLKQRVIDENIDNIIFKGWVDKKYIPSILSKSNFNILHYENSIVYKYGTSQNKNFDYLASGKPILSTICINKSYDIVEKNNAGKTITNQTIPEITNAVLELRKLSKNTYNEMCKNARETAKQYNIDVLSNKLIKIVNNVIKNMQ